MLDLIEPLWTFAAEWKLRLLVVIVSLQMLLAVRLYTVMSKHRVHAAREGRVEADVYKATQNEPEDLAVYTRAVANQFEAPVLFYALVALSLALGVTSWLTVLLAAVYVALRWLHANEMVGDHVVLRRRKLFIRSFQVLLVMMAEFFVSSMIWA